MNVLVVTSVASDLEQLLASLDSNLYSLSLTDESGMMRMLASGLHFSCILVRVTTNAAIELQSVTKVKDRWPAMQIVAYGNQWQIPSVVQAIKLGADEVCEFPCPRGELGGVLERLTSTEKHRRPLLSDVIPPEILQKLKSDEARILHLLVLHPSLILG